MKLLEYRDSIPSSRWISSLGVLLFLINLVLFLLLMRSKRSTITELEKERNEYKAKMFDMQSSQPTPTEVESNDD